VTYARSALFRDFCRFASAQVTSGDIDPMYPVLRRLYQQEGLPERIALWRTILYVTWYHVGSAEQVWRKWPEPRPLSDEDVFGLPTGIERRGFRGNALATQFVGAILRASFNDPAAWLRDAASPGGTAGWDAVRAQLGSVKWAGPWATYKMADLLKHVHGFDITASSIGDKLGATAGPIPGMCRVTGLPWTICAHDVGAQQDMLRAATDLGTPLNGLDQLETALCDFNSLLKGGYYVGHDIDGQMTQLAKSSPALWEQRVVFADRYRGECADPPWFGVRKPLRRMYSQKGVLLT
jgi:hypothetical protein